MKTTVKYIIAFVFNLMVAMSAFAQSDRMIAVYAFCGTAHEFQRYMKDQDQKLYLHGKNVVINSLGSPINTALFITLGATGEYSVVIVDNQGAVCVISSGIELQPYLPTEE